MRAYNKAQFLEKYGDAYGYQGCDSVNDFIDHLSEVGIRVYVVGNLYIVEGSRKV